MIKQKIAGLFLGLIASTLYAVDTSTTSASSKMTEINAIVAVVNETPILQNVLDQRVNLLEKQLEARHITLPPLSVIQNQALNQLIAETLQLQLAESRHIQVSQFQVSEQLQKIADDQKISISELYKQASDEGLTRDAYRKQLQDQMIIHQLVQTLAAKISVTPQDVALYRSSQLAHGVTGKEYHVENILIALPNAPTTEQVTAAEKKANTLLKEIQSGKISFEEAQATEDSGQFSLEQGDLGFRPLAELPEIYAEHLVDMQAGDVYGPLRAGNGIQLIKLVAVKDQQAQLTDAQIREALFKRKLEEAYPLWLSSLESQAYIQKNI